MTCFDFKKNTRHIFLIKKFEIIFKFQSAIRVIIYPSQREMLNEELRTKI